MLIFLSVLQFVLIVWVVVYLTLNARCPLVAEPVAGPLAESPRVSVCVPARNEERDVGACLTSLLNQDYPDFEVIVVDDNSTDNTPDIIESLQARYPNLIAIRGAPLPPDWYGKPFALHQAIQKAQGELLLFADADPVFQPHTLTTAVHLIQKHQVDMVTLLPGAVFGSFWERVVQPVIFVFIGAIAKFAKVNDPKSDAAMGVGHFILMRREVYDQVGGYESLKQAIVEDIEMARLLKRSGARILMAEGKKVYSIRMYHSLKEIWIGWRKNIFVAMKNSILKTLYYIFWILGFVITPWLVAGVHLWWGSDLWLQAMGLAGLFLVFVSKAVLCYELKLKMHTLFLFPLGALVMAAIMINSMIQVKFRGGSEWRGRIYSQPEK